MMKPVLVALATLISTQAFAADILSARVDQKKQSLELQVRYGGGCKKHNFELKIGGCLESMPVQCGAELVHTIEGGFDGCEAIIVQDVSIPFTKAGLVGDYFSNASLTISSKGSKASVKLPATLPPESSYTPSTEPAPSKPNAPARRSDKASDRCVTHTGSFLTIYGDSRVRIESTDGQTLDIPVTKVSRMSLESNPPVDQTTYKLNDGRSIQTSYRGDSKKGTGYYIRVNGEYSPSFECVSLR